MPQTNYTNQQQVRYQSVQKTPNRNSEDMANKRGSSTTAGKSTQANTSKFSYSNRFSCEERQSAVRSEDRGVSVVQESKVSAPEMK